MRRIYPNHFSEPAGPIVQRTCNLIANGADLAQVRDFIRDCIIPDKPRQTETPEVYEGQIYLAHTLATMEVEWQLKLLERR